MQIKRRPKTIQQYIAQLRDIERDEMKDTEYGSILLLSLVEEVGEMARAYLAEHGRKPRNIKAQQDETYKQELGDLLVSIMKLALYKNIDLDERIRYTIAKIKRRKRTPKQ
jgi:NTP pyrophosphatase (non-canonical NTP hydrolase)